ncbi:lactonohydrolase [Phyllosticta capitalensis]
MLALATNPNYFSTLPATSGIEPAVSFLSYNDGFKDLLGDNITSKLIGNYTSHQPFHEGGVYNKETNTMIISSNYEVGPPSDSINITVLNMDDWSIQSTSYANLFEANGGTSYYPPGANKSAPPTHQVWADEGNFEQPSSLVSVNIAENTTEVILNSFMGRNFSSINDVRQHSKTGDLWFTDADYGWFQYFRPEPTVPKQVYRFEPDTGIIQVVADGFVESNGLEFSPDEKTLYVTDTGSAKWSQFNYTRPSTIYAFDVVNGKRLSNRRTFAFADIGSPDGIHCDTAGNVWAGIDDGVAVWNPEGILLGKIYIGETSNNFAFIPGGVLVFTNNRLWLIDGMKAQGREVCKDFGVGC